MSLGTYDFLNREALFDNGFFPFFSQDLTSKQLLSFAEPSCSSNRQTKKRGSPLRGPPFEGSDVGELPSNQLPNTVNWKLPARQKFVIFRA